MSLIMVSIKFDENIYAHFSAYAVSKADGNVYYEDYIARLMEENDSHLYNLIKDYETFNIA